MYRNRIIPCLLLSDRKLVKTVNFKKPRYVGDPINAVKIFNEKEVDELIFLDIDASKNNGSPDFEYLSSITAQCFMPLCYGGGVKSIEDIKRLFSIGFEKVAICTAAYDGEQLVKEAVSIFGSQSIVGCVDVKRNIFGEYSAYINSSTRKVKDSLINYVERLASYGVGEILINNISRDGTMQGYDDALIDSIASKISVPLIICGGAASVEEMVAITKSGRVDAASAGSLFVYYGENRAVLINYPTSDMLVKLFEV